VEKDGELNIRLSLPKADEEPPRWKVVRARGNKLTVQMPLGELIFEFQEDDAFTTILAANTAENLSVTFRRLESPEE
jgi:hypothetical protein